MTDSVKEYRRHINLYKYYRKHGVGWLIPWKPSSFRTFIHGYRQMVVLCIIEAVVVLLAAVVWMGEGY